VGRFGKVPAPVRVRLKRVNCDQAEPYPPDGQPREWWRRLKNAMGTSSSAFVAASLQQLIAPARLPNSGICEIAVNASLAFIEGAKPRDEIECALLIQMAWRHDLHHQACPSLCSQSPTTLSCRLRVEHFASDWQRDRIVSAQARPS
jgi:hypothetical protein